MRRVEEQAVRMLGLIDDLLDLQRLETGLMSLEQSSVDLVDLATRTAEELRLTTSHTITVRAEHTGSAGTVVVPADRRRIVQVLTNLLQNAIRYSPTGGEIKVTVRRAPRPDGDGDQAILAVSDNGIGIAPTDLPHVFSRFYQVAGGRLHRGVRGLGIGLYIAREIVERHGGAIWVESAENEGSTFYVTLPIKH